MGLLRSELAFAAARSGGRITWPGSEQVRMPYSRARGSLGCSMGSCNTAEPLVTLPLAVANKFRHQLGQKLKRVGLIGTGGDLFL